MASRAPPTGDVAHNQARALTGNQTLWEATLWLSDWCSTHWATPARVFIIFHVDYCNRFLNGSLRLSMWSQTHRVCGTFSKSKSNHPTCLHKTQWLSKLLGEVSLIFNTAYLMWTLFTLQLHLIPLPSDHLLSVPQSRWHASSQHRVLAHTVFTLRIISSALTLLTSTLSSELSLWHFFKNAFPLVPGQGPFPLLHDFIKACFTPSEHYPLFSRVFICVLSIDRDKGPWLLSTAHCRCSINICWVKF